jgi:glycogen phosphorylase
MKLAASGIKCGTTITAKSLLSRFQDHLKYTRARHAAGATDFDKLASLSLAIRDLAVGRMLATQKAYHEGDVKRVHYLSMEFLMGRLLANNVISLGLWPVAEEVLGTLGLDLERVCNFEPDAGLGNGGLGRLAACFLDSLATLEYPAFGYGIRYEHGMFRQEFDNGWQRERPDDWLKFGNPWEIIRPEDTVPVLVYGRMEDLATDGGPAKPVWVDWQMIEGVPYDLPIVGCGVSTVNILRLWRSRAAEGFRLEVFNQGDYVRAVEEQNWAENVSKVLYPSENTHAGKELRLIQEYFLVACSIRDAMRRHLKRHASFDNFADKNAFQLNDTHPALAVAELMRHLVDEHNMPWDHAWDITVASLGYTNHTLLPEALEKWSVDLMERVLPRHLQIIYQINHFFLKSVRVRYPGDDERIRRMSLIEEGPVKQVRMANLAIVGSHAINGVAQLHTDLLKTKVVPDFAEMWPERFSNKTNGITQRRWLLACNPGLAALITDYIGDSWVRDLNTLRGLEPFAKEREFLQRFLAVKQANKDRLAALILERYGLAVDPQSLFDVQVKRLHEYKRQLLNALHIIALYYRIKDNPAKEVVPRTFIFGAKAAPGYHMAKRVIKLLNSIGEALAHDPEVRNRLRVVFLPDYCVSLAETIIPAADLSEQISTAGKEASGTGNMKLSLNGALTIGTWDGANIEIAEAVGHENIFIFGNRVEQLEAIARAGYRPLEWLERDAELRRVVLSIRQGVFDQGDCGLFEDIHSALTEWGDPYFHLADFRSYADAQQQAAELFRDRRLWAHKAALNVARMGHFSSDRSIREYAQGIWSLKPVAVDNTD